MTGQRSSQGTPLSPRQRDVLSLYAKHGHWQGVAKELGLTLQHVKNVAQDAYRRLGVGNTLEAYLALGWLTIPSGTKPRPKTILDTYLDDHPEIPQDVRDAIDQLCEAVNAERMMYLGERIGQEAVATLVAANSNRGETNGKRQSEADPDD